MSVENSVRSIEIVSIVRSPVSGRRFRFSVHMERQIQRTPEQVYTYLPAKYAIPAVLHKQLLLCHADRTNDSFEFNYRLVYPKGISKDEAMERARIDFDTIIPEYAKSTFFVSLSETPTNKPLWGHYGDKGKGICLGFHFDLSIDGDKLLNKVEYDGPYTIHVEEVNQFETPPERLKEIIAGVLTTKRAEWSYEKEWRLLIPTNFQERLERDKDGREFFAFAPRELSSVHFGEHCSGLDIGRMALVCLKNGFEVPFFQVEKQLKESWDNHSDPLCPTFQMDFVSKRLSTKTIDQCINMAIMAGCYA